MRRSQVIVVAGLVMALIVNAGPTWSQQSQPVSTLPQQFDALMQMLNQRALDMGRDGLSEAIQRQTAIEQAISRFSENLHAAALDEQAMRALTRDVVAIQSMALPRLSGNVVRVGPKQPLPDLLAAQPTLRAGDLVVMDAGEYQMFETRNKPLPSDVAFVGHGPEVTTVLWGRDVEIDRANRLLIADVRIDCRDNPIGDLRNRSDGLSLRGCEVGNYNSGAGGSNSIFASAGAMFLDECLFDGEKGRAARGGNMGDALDLRGAWLQARRCQFVNNDEIVRASDLAVFDGCTMLDTIGHGRGVTPYAPDAVWLRDSDSVLDPRTPPANVNRFAHPTDDLDFIQFVLDPAKPIDDVSRQLAESIALHRRLPYWIGLVRHRDSRVRELAAGRLQQLVDLDVNLPEGKQPDGERLADLGVLFAVEQEYTRLMNWFEQNRDRLQWNDASGRYRIEEIEPERKE